MIWFPMVRVLYLLSPLIVAIPLFAIEVKRPRLEFLGAVTLPHKMLFKKTKIGGLSAAWFDVNENILFAVSDDRGNINEPRLYKFKIDYRASRLESPLEVTPVEVVILHHDSEKRLTLDMEAMAPLPWGNFLIASEGDNNKKPRSPPLLMDVKKDGTWVRNFEVPAKFIPQATGKQSKGIQNNKGFEGLTFWGPTNRIWAWTEASLVQDLQKEPGLIRVIQYEMPEAWVIKATKEFLYQTENSKESDQQFQIESGVSDVLAIRENEALVLERGLQVKKGQIGFQCQIFQAFLQTADDVSKIEKLKAQDVTKIKKIGKSLVLDLNSIQANLNGPIDNFEAMAWGPKIDGKPTIILISDDNFSKMQSTQFVLFRFEDI